MSARDKTSIPQSPLTSVLVIMWVLCRRQDATLKGLQGLDGVKMSSCYRMDERDSVSNGAVGSSEKGQCKGRATGGGANGSHGMRMG